MCKFDKDRRQCYKTFYLCNNILLVISQSFCPWQVIQANSNVNSWCRSLPEWSTFQAHHIKLGSRCLMRLCHPPDGSTSPKYKLVCFITTKKFCKEKNALAFNRDRCCQLVLCLWLIPFHFTTLFSAQLTNRPNTLLQNVLALLNIMLWLIGLTHKLQRKWSFVNAAPGA